MICWDSLISQSVTSPPGRPPGLLPRQQRYIPSPRLSLSHGGAIACLRYCSVPGLSLANSSLTCTGADKTRGHVAGLAAVPVSTPRLPPQQ